MDNNQQGTGFTNVNQIVQANRNNRLGQTVQGGVNNVIGQGQQQLSGAQQQFNTDATKNQIGTAADQAYVNQTIQNPNNIQQSDVDRFSQLRSGQYQGPTQLGNRDQLGAIGQNLQGIGNAAASEAGRQGLLQRFVAPQQQYTQGQQRLDTLLLGQTGGQAVRQARQGANQFNQNLIGADQAAQAQGQGYQQQAQQFGTNLTNQLNTAQTGQATDLQNRATQQQQQSDAARSALMALFTQPTAPAPVASGQSTIMPVGTPGQTITQDQYNSAKTLLDQAGLSGDILYGQNSYMNNPGSIIGGSTVAPTAQQVATDDDKAKALALAKLSGNQSTLFNQDTVTGGYNPLNFLNQDNLSTYLKQNQAQNTVDTSALNPTNNMFATDKFDQPTILKQGQEISNLAQQLQNTDPGKATQYQNMANDLMAYGSGGKGYLGHPDAGDKADYTNLYNEILNKYGSSDQYQNTPLTLDQRLKKLISG